MSQQTDYVALITFIETLEELPLADKCIVIKRIKEEKLKSEYKGRSIQVT